MRLPLLISGITVSRDTTRSGTFRRQFPGRVIGIRPRQTFRLRGDGIVPLDADDATGLRDLCQTFRFGSVLNCVATARSSHVNSIRPWPGA